MTPGQFILIPLGAALLIVGIVGWWAWKCERVHPVDRCPRCGYDLRGNRRDGCPECGWNTRRPIRRL